MNESRAGTNKAIVGILVVVLLGIAATAVFVASNNTERDNSIALPETTTATTNTSDESVQPSVDSQPASYKDGDYDAQGSYITPGGSESIDLSVTLVDGVVTSATITQNAITGEAKEFQSRFASGFGDEVKGKNIDEINLSRVAGSSLTPIGFNSALEDIKNEARV